VEREHGGAGGGRGELRLERQLTTEAGSARTLPLAPYYFGRVAIGRTPKKQQPSDSGINVDQKIVID
jgi:hypothetical protein